MSIILPKHASKFFLCGVAEESKDLTHVLRSAEEMVCSKRLIIEGAHVHCLAWLEGAGQQVGHSGTAFLPPIVVGKGSRRKVSVCRVKACAVMERVERARKECAGGARSLGAAGKR